MSSNAQIVNPAQLSEQSTAKKPVVVVVHGIGRQSHFDTLRAFMDGWCRAFGIPFSLTRAQLAASIVEGGMGALDGLPFDFLEYNYAQNIEDHKDLAESSPRRWIQTIRRRLQEIDGRRRGAHSDHFRIIDSLVDDVLFATQLSKIIADRIRIQTGSIEHDALHFFQQAQLFIDHSPYRRSAINGLKEKLQVLTDTNLHGNEKIILVTHSLGTVVAFLALMEAIDEKSSWASHVSHLITFGSPLDLFYLVFPEMFRVPSERIPDPIDWTNYSLGNDPIATDLPIVRATLMKTPGLFMENAPDEVNLGSGKFATAHTDYWQDERMMNDIRRIILNEDDRISGNEIRSALKPATAAPRSGSAIMFIMASVVLSLVAAWLMVVWWEENLKESDADRATLLEPPLMQLSACGLLLGCVFTHVLSWSGNKYLRIFTAVICLVFCSVAIYCLPKLANAFVEIAVDDGKGVIDEVKGWGTNFLLLLIPASAILGAVVRFLNIRGSAGKMYMAGFLAFISVILTMFVGRRDNPSNATAEIALLAITFIVWWLAILLSRIGHVYLDYVGGRRHLDFLADQWATPQAKRHFRTPR